eukprot:CAMPEP_0206039480 /NCGR_PEP_ID=MMETSP1466-20131121/4784_1 /ASSEMBLY_ACC=CAM_ASM_001126 /TAXON_ID=44452 /ORGANISM="Pavlova gyrans, Strain CCMP608" /LENGTH=163 /DNA_ID=CAMNT_0053414119 /DNA_START=287 /DNA_END=775 /DNA_ORIENTATION=+
MAQTHHVHAPSVVREQRTPLDIAASLWREGGAAAAGGLRIRVVLDFKGGPDHLLHVVHGGALEVLEGEGVDEHFDAVLFYQPVFDDSSSGSGSSLKEYWNPEQPPLSTETRSTFGASAALRLRSRCTQLSVMRIAGAAASAESARKLARARPAARCGAAAMRL